jgi:hypothetical protein
VISVVCLLFGVHIIPRLSNLVAAHVILLTQLKVVAGSLFYDALSVTGLYNVDENGDIIRKSY